MIELKDLYHLIKIADCGTISKAAEELYLSQPALSRAMHRLESELGLKLFSRTRNRVELNENGNFFVRSARAITGVCEDAVRRVRAFDKERASFAIGACAPTPMWEAVRSLSSVLPGRLSTQIESEEKLVRGLLSGAYKMIIVCRPIEIEGVVCREYCREKLYLSVPAGHRLAGEKSVTFEDIDGITMLLLDNIGVWNSVRERMPHTRFIVQKAYEDFSDLVRLSDLPSFTSWLVRDGADKAGRVRIPVEGEGSEYVFYVCSMAENAHYLPKCAKEAQKC